MIATVAYIKEKFDEFNQSIFGGELPRIPIVLGRATRVIGSFTYKARRNFWGKVHHYYNAVSNSPTVSQVELYITLNPFFGQYPCSSALRIHYIDPEILQSQLADASKVVF